MRKLVLTCSIVLLLLTALNALVAGTLFILDPSGRLMGMNTSFLDKSPFTTYLVPGIVLFIVNGLMNCIALYHVFKKTHSSTLLIMMQGILLCGWIVVQVIMVQAISFLHITMFIIGVVLLLFGIALKNLTK